MLTYKQWLLEAIPLSTYRKLYKQVGSHYQSQYDKWFGKESRIYIPLSGAESDPIYDLVNKELSKSGYQIDSWKDGLAKKKDSNRVMRIGKLLSDNQEALKKFNERFKGKEASEDKEYEIVISRHLYDVAGQSTDRAWTSCKSLEDGENRHYIPFEAQEGFLIAYVIEKDGIERKEELSDIHPSLLKNKLINDVIKTFDSIDSLNLINNLKSLRPKSKEIENRKGAITNKDIDEALELIKNSKPLTIKRTTKNINDPISRLLIVPYVNSNDPKDTFLFVPDRTYGKSVSGFRETVQKWLDSKQGKKEALYCLAPKNIIYVDKFPKSINTKTGDKSLYNPEINNFNIGPIPIYKNGTPIDYDTVRLVRYVIDKKDTYPLAAFIENLMIEEQEIINAGIQGNIKIYIINSLKEQIDSYQEEEEYFNYYKKLLSKIEKDLFKVRITFQ